MRTVGVVIVAISLMAVAPGAAVGAGGTDDGSAGSLADPENDVIGWENGYWYNESISVDQRDGLTDAERRAYVGRAMARVEKLRDKEFKRNVTVEALPRAEYQRLVRVQAQRQFGPAQRAWENQVWEALFAVDETTDAVREQVEIRTKRVAGFYLPGTDSIYTVTDRQGSLVVDNATLVHELVHALQDQHVGLTSESLRAETMDGRRGQEGLVEGEATLVEKLYTRRCGDEWECVTTPGPEPPRAPYSGGPLPDYNLAMQVASIQPYSDGPAYVAAQVDATNESVGNWSRLDYQQPPVSSEQIIESERTVDPPPTLRIGALPANGWKLFGKQGVNGSQTVGEAGIYTMFWYQGRADDNRVIPWRRFESPDQGSFDEFNYTSVPSDGWANDRLWPVRNGERRGYVWRTAWDTAEDAREFQRAYRELLAGRNATKVGPNTWVIDRGGFGDAFHVVRDGKTVTVVNGPTVGALDDVRPSVTVTARARG
ncbi:Hvo_1808 family surface protein [Halomicrococcus gelatinilyticus]|uniref:Hvo_1808 family surface protein n=1 Tax=Halomicrococcus gelatinilyticus TaxID=1702103 RepID=UPI002E160865